MKAEESKQNIFSWKKRTNEDFINRPLPFSRASEDELETRLKEEGEKNLESFTKFMEKNYALFEHKINKCKLKCAQKSKSYSDNKRCYMNCGSGLITFRRFVDSRLTQMQDLLGQCVSHSQTLTDSLYETYHCFQLYNKGFQHLKQVIKQQSLYYE